MTQQEKYLWYKEKKRFGFAVLPIYKKNEFDKAVQVLNFQKADFVYIHNKLNANDRLEFKNDYCDQLVKLKEFQGFSKYKELIEKQIQEVINEYKNAIGVESVKLSLSNKPVKKELQLEDKESENDKEFLNTFCKSMPLNIPKEHFKVLTIKKSKNKKPFLKEKEFNRFIERAFLGHNQLNKIKFNQAPKGEKLKLQYLFREFYEINYFQYGISQDNFIKLLTDNFIGWDFNNVKNNFKTKPTNTL